MKPKLFAGLLTLALVPGAGATDLGYTNNDVLSLTVPPQIDAWNFVNNGSFAINQFVSPTTVGIIGGFGGFTGGFSLPYETASTTNYLNAGVLDSSTGFRFDYFNRQTQQRQMAASVVNASSGVINCGTSTNLFALSLQNGSVFSVSATNIVNRGTINLGPDSLLSLQGQNIDLSLGLLNMQGFESGGSIYTVVGNNFFLGSPGMFDGYWGVGTTTWNPGANLSPTFAFSPAHWVTNRTFLNYQQQVALSNPSNYVNDFMTDLSNRVVQAAFVSEPNPAVSNKVYFLNGEIAVEWSWLWTNIVTGLTTTNYLYLFDALGSVSNLMVITNGVSGPSAAYYPTYIPTNYTFFRSSTPMFTGFPSATPGLLQPTTFDNAKFTNDYAGYEVLLEPTTVIPGEVAGQTVANMPGRVEISAGQQLTLDRARIASLNYLRISATNNFTTSGQTRIVSPFADFELYTTNGLLVFTNLLAPVVPRLEGTCDLFSARWTNVANVVFGGATNTVTNLFQVLLVDSHLQTATVPQVMTLKLGSTNVVITDVLNVMSNLVIDAQTLTVASNSPGSTPPAGQLNLLSGAVLGPNSLPRLQALTNHGVIRNYNSAVFRGSRFPPYFPASFEEPYRAFVNDGSIVNYGSSIWADYFQNNGNIVAQSAGIAVQAQTAVLANGAFFAPSASGGDITIVSGSLSVRNHGMQAGGQISLSVTNALDDGGTANFWTVGYGFNLPILPAAGDLLGTTVTGIGQSFADVPYQWAGQDRGSSVAGFRNNAALGRLILDAQGPDTTFSFTGAGTNNALYVDSLELRNYATNRPAGAILSALNIAGNMRIYFAQAIINGQSVAEKLNHANGDRLRWVAAYAGRFSSTNVVYPDGTTNTLNAALAASCNLDSNNNGIVNCIDPAPVFVPSELQFQVTLTNAPQPAALLSWQSIGRTAFGDTTNTLFFRSSLTATNWQVLTNFVTGPYNQRVSVLDPLGAASRFYQVRVDVAQP